MPRSKKVGLNPGLRVASNEFLYFSAFFFSFEFFFSRRFQNPNRISNWESPNWDIKQTSEASTIEAQPQSPHLRQIGNRQSASPPRRRLCVWAESQSLVVGRVSGLAVLSAVQYESITSTKYPPWPVFNFFLRCADVGCGPQRGWTVRKHAACLWLTCSNFNYRFNCAYVFLWVMGLLLHIPCYFLSFRHQQ